MSRATKTLIATVGLTLGALLVGGCPDLTSCPDCGVGEVEYTVPDDCEIGEEDEVTAVLEYDVNYDIDNCPRERRKDGCEASGSETISSPVRGAGESDRVDMPVETWISPAKCSQR